MVKQKLFQQERIASCNRCVRGDAHAPFVSRQHPCRICIEKEGQLGLFGVAQCTIVMSVVTVALRTGDIWVQNVGLCGWVKSLGELMFIGPCIIAIVDE